MLSEKMIFTISQQIKKEYESAYLYLEIADFYEAQGLCGFANWFKVQAREEEDHAMIFYEYLHSNNACVQFYAIEPCVKKFSDLRAPLKAGLKHEEFITDSINKIYELAEKEKDLRTENFLNWFVVEQQEEEEKSQELLDKMDLFGANPAGLYQLDKEYENRSYTPSSKLKK